MLPWETCLAVSLEKAKQRAGKKRSSEGVEWKATRELVKRSFKASRASEQVVLKVVESSWSASGELRGEQVEEPVEG